MTTNVPLQTQISYMLEDMGKANSKEKCSGIYQNYINLYRDEYPKAHRSFTTAYNYFKISYFYVNIQD